MGMILGSLAKYIEASFFLHHLHHRDNPCCRRCHDCYNYHDNDHCYATTTTETTTITVTITTIAGSQTHPDLKQDLDVVPGDGYQPLCSLQYVVEGTTTYKESMARVQCASALYIVRVKSRSSSELECRFRFRSDTVQYLPIWLRRPDGRRSSRSNLGEGWGVWIRDLS